MTWALACRSARPRSPWPAVARPSRHGLGSDAMERPGARVGRRAVWPGRAGSARARDGAEHDRHADPTCRSVATAGRRARRPAGRRGCREHVARRGALAGAAVSVVSGRRRQRRRARAGERSPGRETRCARLCSMPVRLQRVPQGGKTLSTVRRADSLAWARRRQPHRVLVPGVSADGRFSGEGGIRTLDERITTRNALAGRRLQPLGHLSRVAQDIGRPSGLRQPASRDAVTLYLPRRGAGAVERGGLENR